MTNPFQIALVQHSAIPFAAEKNLEKAVALCRQAKTDGADLVLFPEMWSSAYAFPPHITPETVQEWYQGAVSQNSRYIRSLRETARELGIGIAATCLYNSAQSEFPLKTDASGTPDELFPPDTRPQNSALLIAPNGEILLEYSKVHLCAWGPEGLLRPGNEFPVCSFPLPQGETVRLGVMICYDREFPESARCLMLGGAEIILVPNACDMNPARLGQLSARAFENMVGVAMANYPGEKHGCSCAFSPVNFNEHEEYVNPLLGMAGHDEQTILHVRFDLDKLRRYRQAECWGNAYRRPDVYDALVKKAIDPPFIRPNHWESFEK